jgi:hypothetical protein
MLSFEGSCRPYIPYNSRDDFRHRGHIKYHSIFLYVGIGLSVHYLECLGGGGGGVVRFPHPAELCIG